MQHRVIIAVVLCANICLLQFCAISQSKEPKVDERWSTNEYRDTHWNPDEGKYFFGEMWTWTYTNEMLEMDDPQRSGEMSIFVDTPSGTMLLTKADTKYNEDMIQWIIIHPDGRYTLGGSNELGQPLITSTSVQDFKELSFRLEHQEEDFRRYVKDQHTTKTFEVNAYGSPTIEGKAHLMSYEMTQDQNLLYLIEVPFSMHYLYLVDKIISDIHLPISLDYAHILPENMLILSDTYQNAGKTIQMQIIGMTPTEYFIDLKK